MGTGRLDVIQLILPKLIDGDGPVRKAAAEAILILTGAQDKDALLQVLDGYGVTAGINCGHGGCYGIRVEDSDYKTISYEGSSQIMQCFREKSEGSVVSEMQPQIKLLSY